MKASPNFRNGKFQNPVPTRKMLPGSFGTMLYRQIFGREQRVPRRALPIIELSRRDFSTPPTSGLRVTWLGHSTALLEIDGLRLLIDPVWSERASPSSLVGPRRFHPPPLPLHELPPLDAVLISHNHYDHLDRGAVRVLAPSGVLFITALGVGKHFEKWGVAADRIVELDWGESTSLGELTVTATPARHFSGRGLFDGERTLWASWVLTGPGHRVFYSGDTGFFAGIEDIGREHGPFDLTLVKVGAYDSTWPDIHLNPEDAVRAHIALRGNVFVPVHWGTFNLAFHAWNEPPERLLEAARATNIQVMIPLPGMQLEPAAPSSLQPWWRD